MTQKHFLIGMAYLTLLLGMGFYWYEVRPMSIRAKCEIVARTAVKDRTVPLNDGTHTAYEEAYTGCLRFAGINR